jgi:multidrug efflux pump subunit AcrA (membrane-fusion protein)
VVLFEVPVMVTVVSVETATVATLNVTVVAPARTVAVAGTVTAGELEVRVIG